MCFFYKLMRNRENNGWKYGNIGGYRKLKIFIFLFIWVWEEYSLLIHDVIWTSIQCFSSVMTSDGRQNNVVWLLSYCRILRKKKQEKLQKTVRKRNSLKQNFVSKHNEQKSKRVTFITTLTFKNKGRSWRVAKFLSESYSTFHIKSKAIKMLSCKNFATLLDPPLKESFRRLFTKII